MRKTKIVQITDDNRDKGKVFLLTEMSAMQVEKWAARAFLAVTRAGVEVPPDLMGSGIAGLMTLGIKSLMAGLDFVDVEPLMDEMIGCVRFVPNFAKNPEVVRPLIADPANPDGDDIQEAATLLRLRAEVINLHVDFFSAGATFRPKAPAKAPA